MYKTNCHLSIVIYIDQAGVDAIQYEIAHQSISFYTLSKVILVATHQAKC